MSTSSQTIGLFWRENMRTQAFRSCTADRMPHYDNINQVEF